MDNVTSLADIAGIMTRFVLVLIGIRVMVWWCNFNGERPVWLPFKTFRWICSHGEKQPIENFTKISEFTKFRYLDTRYQAWKDDCVTANKLTHSEYMAFEYPFLLGNFKQSRVEN